MTTTQAGPAAPTATDGPDLEALRGELRVHGRSGPLLDGTERLLAER